MSDLERRSAALAFVALVLGLLWSFWDVLGSNGILFFRDHCTIFRRAIEAAVLAYGEGRMPLWDEYTGGGEPLGIYPAAMSYSPLLVLFALPAGFDSLYDWFVFVHYPLAALGVAFLLRTLRAGWSAAIIGGTAYALSGALIALNCLLPLLASMVWAPFALAMALRVVEDPQPRNVALFAVFLAMHVVTMDPSVIVADVLLFLALVDRLPSRTASLALLGGGVLAASLGAIVILPLLELLGETQRGAGFSYAAIAGFSLHPLHLLELFFPGFGGDSIEARATFDIGEHGRLYLGSIYAGASAFPLLVAGLRRRRLAIAAVLLAILALGRFTPIHGWMLDVLPMLSSSRFPVKYACGLALAIAIAIGLGMDGITERSRRLILISTLVLAVVTSAVLTLELLPEDQQAVIRAAAAQGLIFAVAGAAVTLAWISKRIPGWLAPPLLALILAFDLALAARPLLPAGDRAIVERPPIADVLFSDEPHPSILLYEPLRPPALIAQPNAEELTLFGAQRLEPGIAGRLGVRSVIDVSLNAARPKFWEDAVADFFRRPEPERLQLLARWGVTHVLVESNRTHVPGLRFVGRAPVAGGEPITAFRVLGARPFLSAKSATVSIAYHVPGEIRATVTSTVPGLLVAAQRFDPGWHAQVNGAPAELVRTDGLMLGVPIPEGRAEVEIRYRPASFTTGAWITLFGLFSLAALIAIDIVRRRSR